MFTDQWNGPHGLPSRRRIVSLRALRLAVGLWLILVNVDASAADRLGAAEKVAIRETIQKQIDAFGRGDADGAFAFATPDIQRLFGSPDQFIEMVKEHYEPVYRAGIVHFVRIDSVEGQWVQVVQITDGDGRVWRAFFTMKRQPDKSWKGGGCQLVQTSAIAT